MATSPADEDYAVDMSPPLASEFTGTATIAEGSDLVIRYTSVDDGPPGVPPRISIEPLVLYDHLEPDANLVSLTHTEISETEIRVSLSNPQVGPLLIDWRVESEDHGLMIAEPDDTFGPAPTATFSLPAGEGPSGLVTSETRLLIGEGGARILGGLGANALTDIDGENFTEQRRLVEIPLPADCGTPCETSLWGTYDYYQVSEQPLPEYELFGDVEVLATDVRILNEIDSDLTVVELSKSDFELDRVTVEFCSQIDQAGPTGDWQLTASSSYQRSDASGAGATALDNGGTASQVYEFDIPDSSADDSPFCFASKGVRIDFASVDEWPITISFASALHHPEQLDAPPLILTTADVVQRAPFDGRGELNALVVVYGLLALAAVQVIKSVRSKGRAALLAALTIGAGTSQLLANQWFSPIKYGVARPFEMVGWGCLVALVIAASEVHFRGGYRRWVRGFISIGLIGAFAVCTIAFAVAQVWPEGLRFIAPMIALLSIAVGVTLDLVFVRDEQVVPPPPPPPPPPLPTREPVSIPGQSLLSVNSSADSASRAGTPLPGLLRLPVRPPSPARTGAEVGAAAGLYGSLVVLASLVVALLTDGAGGFGLFIFGAAVLIGLPVGVGAGLVLGLLVGSATKSMGLEKHSPLIFAAFSIAMTVVSRMMYRFPETFQLATVLAFAVIGWRAGRMFRAKVTAPTNAATTELVESNVESPR